MNLVVRSDPSGRCIWVRNGGFISGADVFKDKLAQIDQAQLAELLAVADDEDEIEANGGAEVLAKRISSILGPILSGLSPNLTDGPVFEVPAAIAEALNLPKQLKVAEWIKQFPPENK